MRQGTGKRIDTAKKICNDSKEGDNWKLAIKKGWISVYKIMFVDDEPWAVVDMMHSIPWEETGFTVAGYWDKPTVAFEKIIAEQPEVVFTDIRMPTWDGFEMIRRCREAGSMSEFVILSSYSDFLFAKQAIKAAVLDYLLKPVNPVALKEVLEEIRVLLDERHSEKQVCTEDTKESAEGFDNILNYISQNHHLKLDLSHLADHFHFNKNYLCHLFKKHAKTTFISYLTQVRIDAAKILLRESTFYQEEIAARVGFNDQHYFNKVFKAECGCTPLQYRQGINTTAESIHNE